MNFTYFKFLFINTIKRKPVWITWLLFLFTCTCFIIILPLAAKMNTLQIWANTTMAICQTFMGMTAALFTAVLAINIYKENNEEGTELIVISKPITRFSIILTKLLVFLFLCLLVNLSACVITLFTVFLPRTEVKFYWGLIVSMLIGNAVTFGVFGSIAILMSVNFQKVGIIIVNVVLSLVFLIYQALTLFCFSTPAKALLDKSMGTSSYIVMNRDTQTGEYKEEHVVKFVANVLEDKGHPCSEVIDWQGMKHYYENDILGQDPTLALNITDIAGQISLSYLSVGIDDYAYRQAQRMFTLSRFYKYALTSPASPELLDVENQHSMNWMYVDWQKLTIPAEIFGVDINIYMPTSIGYSAISPGTTTRLRGYTDQIPVGYVKSKEIMSQREVYFEKEDWNKYKAPFDLMYDRLFKYENYVDCTSSEPSQISDWACYFNLNNDTVKHYYELIWHCFNGTNKSLIKDAGYGQEYFDIKNTDDLNNRFIQFKYYAFQKAYAEQQALLKGITELDAHETTARTDAANTLQAWSTGLSLNTQYKTDSYMITASDDSELLKIFEPKTTTISFQLLNNTWDSELATLQSEGKSKDQQIDYAIKSGLGIMKKTSNIFKMVSYPREDFLFENIASKEEDTPIRSGKYTGDAHIVSDNWTPYPVTWAFQKLTEKPKGPIGHNLQYFYYSAEPRIQYWIYAIIWGVISIGLLTAGVIVYKRYDFK